jgi:hypothetical protein
MDDKIKKEGMKYDRPLPVDTYKKDKDEEIGSERRSESGSDTQRSGVGENKGGS